MAKDDEEKEKARLKAIKEALKYMREMEESVNRQKSAWEKVTEGLFGLSKSDFFVKLEVSPDYVSALMSEFEQMQDVIKDIGAEVDRSFKNAITGLKKDKNGFQGLYSLIDDFSKQSPEMAESLRKAVKSANLTEFMLEFGDEGLEAFQRIIKDKDGYVKLNKFFTKDAVKGLQETIRSTKALREDINRLGRDTLSFSNALMNITKRITEGFNVAAVKKTILDFDAIIHRTQRDTGIMISQNATKMTKLTMATADFGMSVEETAGLMGQLGAEIRTTNFDVIATAAEDLAAMQQATGLAAEDVAVLNREFMLFGKSSKDTAEFASDTMKTAMIFGVNGRKVMMDMAKNMSKMRLMGFTGGEESLKRMVITAERLGQSIDEIFDVAKRARTIEGALDMAAQLQLAGGTFANINPMDLLAAARKGPEELQKILTRMGGDVGRWVKNMDGKEEYQFDPIDVDRLQIVADATGMSLDSLQKQIAKQAEDNKKLNLLPPSLFGADLSEEEKAYLMNLTKIGDKGLELTTDVEGISDLRKLTPELIRNAIRQQKADRETLEEQAKQNMDFNKTLEGLKTALMNTFTIFEPVIKELTQGLQWFVSKLGSLGKGIVAGLALMFTVFFGPIKQFASGFAFGKGHDAALKGGGFIGGIKDMIGGFFGRKKAPGAGGLPGAAVMGGVTELKGVGAGGLLTSLALGIKAFGRLDMKDLFKFATAMTIVGAGLIGFTVALAKMGGEASLAQLGTVASSLVLLGSGLWLLSKISSKIDMKGVLIGSLAMGVIGLAMIPFMETLAMMQGIKWETLGKMAAAISGAAIILAVMGMGPIPGFILLGALALAAASGSLLLFGLVVEQISTGFEKFAKVDWKSFGMAGIAMLSIVPGLLALGGVGIFALPSLLMMTGILAMLSNVVVVLAPALSMASVAMIKMAEGIDKLKEAVNGLDTDKLEELSDISERLAVASAIGGLANAISAITGGVRGAERPAEIRVQPITVNLKMNGRQIQTEIIEATAHIT